MRRIKRTALIPLNPELGQLINEPYTRTLRIWNGAFWQETTPKELSDMVIKHKSMRRWMEKVKKEREENEKPN